MGKRGRKDWSRGELPLGSIRLRRRRGFKYRMIKVRMGGPKSGRWVWYARWLYERINGPAPAGKRVVHENGDGLDDRPENLILASPGDVAFLAHERDPEMSRANYEACRRGMAAFNRDRAAVRRATSWLPTRFYPVDHARRVVLNRPTRGRWEAFGSPRPAANGRGTAGHVLGWPGLVRGAACLLAALVEAPAGLGIGEAIAACQSICRRHGWEPAGPATPAGFYQAMWRLTAEGLARRSRPPGRPARVYLATAKARRVRAAPSPYTPVRGSELLAGACAGYERVDA